MNFQTRESGRIVEAEDILEVEEILELEEQENIACLLIWRVLIKLSLVYISFVE